jgi:hypothetical protein
LGAFIILPKEGNCRGYSRGNSQESTENHKKKTMNFDEIDNWPNTWKIGDPDVEYGKLIIKLMKPFIKALSGTLSARTVKQHTDNLWVLGGYAIELINSFPEKRHKEPCFLFTTFIDSYDGPHIRDFSEKEQESFDRTCRKYYKYLVANKLRKTVAKPEKLSGTRVTGRQYSPQVQK